MQNGHKKKNREVKNKGGAMRKRLFAVLSIIFLGVFLMACDETDYKVTFDVAGGTPAIASQTIKEDGLVTKPSDPTKDGYTFKFWEEKTSEKEWKFATDKVTKNITLIAQWEEVPPEVEKVTVTFDMKGGTPAVAAQTIDKGAKATEPADPTKDGFEFLGWYKGETAYDFTAAVNENLTLEAKWEELPPQVEKVKVTFDVKGGTPAVAAQTIDKGEKATEPADPTKDGYEFLGWYLGEAKYIFSAAVDENITLVARWEEILVANEYILEFTVTAPEGTIGDIYVSGSFNDWYFEKLTLEAGKYKTTYTLRSFVEVTEIEYKYYNGVGVDPEGDADNEYLEERVLDIVLGENEIIDTILSWEIIILPQLDAPVISIEDGVISWDHVSGYNSYALFAEIAGVEIELTRTFTNSINPEEYSEGIEGNNYYFIKTIGYEDESEDSDNSNKVLHFVATPIEYFEIGGMTTEIAVVTAENYFRRRNATDETAPGDMLYRVVDIKAYLDSGQTITEAYSTIVVLDENVELLMIRTPLTGVTYNLFDGWFTDPTYTSNAKQLEGIAEYLFKDDSLLIGKNEKSVTFTFEDEEKTTSAREFLVYHLVKPWDEFPDVNVGSETWRDDITTFIDAIEVELDFGFDAIAYINDKPFKSVQEAIVAADSGDVIQLAGGEHDVEFHVDKNNLTFTSLPDQVAIITAKISLEPKLDGVKFTNLEFTGDAYIHEPGIIDNFVFVNNKVYDLDLEESPYVPANRTDVNAFIRLYTLEGVMNVVGNVTIENNEFKNINADIISLARSTKDREYNINNNIFHNFIKGAIRFDGGYNNGTYNITNNIFKNDVAGENYGTIVFRCFAPEEGNIQIINILDNEFINVGNDLVDYVEENGHPGSGVITFSTFNDNPTEVYINGNLFRNATRAIHFRNAGAVSDLTADFTGNIFDNNHDYYLYQARTKDYPAPEANFNQNVFIDETGEAITDLAIIGEKVINNSNYDDFYISELELMVGKLIPSIGAPDIYVDISLSKNPGDLVNEINQTFVYGTNAFNNINDALDNAKEGDVIYLAAGTYDENFTVKIDNLTLIGPNFNLPSVDFLRKPEAELSGVITIFNAKNTHFNGLSFMGSSTITNNGVVDGLYFASNIVISDLQALAAGGADGFIKLFASNDEIAHSQIVVVNSAFDFTNEASAPRYLLLSNTRDVYVLNNEFLSAYLPTYTDVIRITGTSLDRTSGSGLSGKFHVYSNTFKDVGQAAIFVTRYGEADVKIIYNDFDRIGTSAARFWHSYDTGSESKFLYTFNKINVNTADTGYTTAGLRIEQAGPGLSVVANYNHFTNIPHHYYFVAPANVDYDARYNFYEGAEDYIPNPDWFSEGIVFDDYYTSFDDLPQYSTKVVIPLTDIEITNKITVLQELREHVLDVVYLPENATNVKLIFESSDESVATITDKGKILALTEGTTIIKVYSSLYPLVSDQFELEVEPRDVFEVRFPGSSTVKVGDSKQLTVVKEDPDKAITYATNEPDLATVSATGLITGIAPGNVVITVSLGDNLHYDLNFAIYDESTVDPAMLYLLENAIGLSEMDVITYVGSDDGSLDFPHELMPSVIPYLFNDEIVMSKNMLSPDAANHSGRKMSSLEWIVVHDTANTSAGAAANSGWATNPANTGSSWHYTVGNDGWYQQLYDNDLGWHAGDGTTTDVTFTDTRIAADGLKPELTISDDGKYVINGTKTAISAPEVGGRTAKTSDLVRTGIWPVIIDGTYHMPATRYTSSAGGNIVFVGGNNNGIGIETAVDRGSDLWLSWQRVAKLVASLLVEHDLLLDRVVFHNHFSAKVCPRSTIESDNVDVWLGLIEFEYYMLKLYEDYQFEFVSHNLDLLDNKGRVKVVPNIDTVVGYTIKVTDPENNVTEYDLTTILKGRYT